MLQLLVVSKSGSYDDEE